jgi:hypothetical protein
MLSAVSEAAILEGLWRFEAPHPEWTEDDGGEDGWERIVAWWAVARPGGIVLIDPLVEDWDALDQLIGARGGCAGVVRTIHWHQRSIPEVVERYGAEVWARGEGDGAGREPLHHPVADRAELFGGVLAIDLERADEIALWLPEQAALVFGDAMLRRPGGELRVCPDSWTQPPAGSARLRALLGALTELQVQHVLVSHGPLVLGDGAAALSAALG